MAKPVKMQDRTAFRLLKPFTFEGEHVEAIHYREPLGGDMRRLNNALAGDRSKAGDATVRLMSDLSEMPEAFFDEMSATDWARFNAEIERFLAGALPTSTT